MGTILTKLYDDYDLYLECCNYFGMDPISMHNSTSFYDHMRGTIESFPKYRIKQLRNLNYYFINKFLPYEKTAK